jgi:hypothetical protein
LGEETVAGGLREKNSKHPIISFFIENLILYFTPDFSKSV